MTPSDLPSVHFVGDPQLHMLWDELCLLRQRNAKLTSLLLVAYERIAAQQELLARKAERCEAS